LPFVKV